MHKCIDGLSVILYFFFLNNCVITVSTFFKHKSMIHNPYNMIRILIHCLFLMCCHDDNVIPRILFEKIHDNMSVFNIQRFGRLIATDDRWLVNQSSCNTDSLFLPTTQFGWILFQQILQLQYFQHGFTSLRKFFSKGNIVIHIQLINQFIVLKDCHDSPFAHNTSFIKPVITGNDIHQCGFPTPRFTPQGIHAWVINIKTDIRKHILFSK